MSKTAIWVFTISGFGTHHRIAEYSSTTIFAVSRGKRKSEKCTKQLLTESAARKFLICKDDFIK
jgi:hypothetical protein